MTASKRMQPKFLTLGKIDRPHGIRGELKMRVFTDYPERVTTLQWIYLARKEDGRGAKRYDISHARFHKDHILLTLAGISDRNSAELIRNQYVLIDMEHAVPLDEDEFYLYELIGMAVFTDEGQDLGEVVDVIETGANDVYVVQGGIYGEVLVPIHDETLLDVDLEAGRISVKLPEGLLTTGSHDEEDEQAD